MSSDLSLSTASPFSLFCLSHLLFHETRTRRFLPSLFVKLSFISVREGSLRFRTKLAGNKERRARCCFVPPQQWTEPNAERVSPLVFPLSSLVLTKEFGDWGDVYTAGYTSTVHTHMNSNHALPRRCLPIFPACMRFSPRIVRVAETACQEKTCRSSGRRRVIATTPHGT